ncbi:MAG: hypothetical protein K5640_01050 [Treponema sp.]|nr:hypothetical protein [Treponema sp.]
MKTVNKKIIIVRSVLVVVYVLLAVVMFVTGRSHTVLIDNKAAEDGSFKAINGMEVTINKLPSSEFMKGDRDKFVVKGQNVKIKVVSFDGQIEDTYKIKIPLAQDAVLISVPKLVNGLEGAVEPFKIY